MCPTALRLRGPTGSLDRVTARVTRRRQRRSIFVRCAQRHGREIVQQGDIVIHTQLHHRGFFLATDGFDTAVQFLGDFSNQETFSEQTQNFTLVTFRYQDNAFSVGPINLTIHRGELLFLIGGNGSGKSTLAMLLTGLYQPQSGEILLDGKALSAEKPEDYRKLFSAVFTDVWLFDWLLGPEGQQADPALVEKWLAHLQMSHKLELQDGKILNLKLSKGQKKRVALLLALAEERDIILLDEWAADQDPHFRREFYQVLLPLMQAMGKTIFAISHDDHYFIHADRLLEMRDGKLSELTGDERDAASRDAVARTA